MSSEPVATLTTRQKDVFHFIRDLIKGRGFGPTVREIGEHFKITSPNGVVCHLKALEKKGYIHRQSGKSRAIELAYEEPTGLPLVGVVAAGPTTLAFDTDDRIDFGEMFAREDMFALRVSGDSMIEAQITDGDFVVVRRQQTAGSGEMVVARTPDGEATLKYWHPEKDRIRLQPANSEMEPIYVSDAVVVGIVVGVVRSM